MNQTRIIVIAKEPLPGTVKTRLIENRHGPSGGVRGAAWLWK